MSVLFHPQGFTKKLHLGFVGPFRILRRINEVAFELELLNMPLLRCFMFQH
jgi:hypothetical protein